MGSEERFVSYVDMPLQHSHPEVLSAMRRGGRAERYLRQLELARELAPDVFLRTTFIVGFPGETVEHFAHLLGFVVVKPEPTGATCHSLTTCPASVWAVKGLATNVALVGVTPKSVRFGVSTGRST
jgi:radical SAM superfamily enzyme